jgi:hypothetical protein
MPTRRGGRAVRQKFPKSSPPAQGGERLRGLLLRAVAVLAEDLNAEDRRLRQQAAVHVLRAVGLYGESHRPAGPTTVDEAEGAAALDEMRRSLLRLGAP